MSIIGQIKTAWNARRGMFYDAFLLAVVVISAGWLRWYCYIHEPTICRDAIQYMRQVENWPNNICTLPLYQGILFRLTQLGIPTLPAALWLGMICGILLPVPIYLLIREFNSSKLSAFLGAALITVNPGLVKISFEMIRDSLFWLLVACGWWLSTAALKRHDRFAAAAAGFCLGLTTWIRYESVEAIMITLVAVCLFVPKDSSKWRNIRKFICRFFVGAICAWLFAMIVCGLPLDFYFLFFRTIYYRFL